MGSAGTDDIQSDESQEYDEALKLALKLSLEEYKGTMHPLGRHLHQQSGFFGSLGDGRDLQDDAQKNKGDLVSMDFILERMHHFRHNIKQKVDQQNPQASPIKEASTERTPRTTISRNLLTDLIELLFGSEESREATAEDIRSWCKQGFSFQEDPNLFWALSQTFVGPCGVLASVQSYMLHCILFHHEIYGSMEHMLTDEPADTVLMKLRMIYFNFITVNQPDFPEEWLHIPSLLEALCALLYNVTPVSSYKIMLFEPLKRQTGFNPIHSIIYNSNYLFKEFNNIADVAVYLLQNLHLLMSEMGVVSFTLSLLATRGIANVQNDMDDPTQPLVGLYGHSTQELVNLMLQGKAVSNVFDGEKVIQDGERSAPFKLKGITKEVSVGFLSEQESKRHCKVGSYFKHPKLPIWVVSSFNHYTVMFALKTKFCKRSEREIYEENAMNVWSCLDQEENRFIQKKMLHSLLEMLAIPTMYPDACASLPLESGIILQNDFMEWYLSKTTRPQPGRGFDEDETVTLFHYNGQDKRSPLTMITVRKMTSGELESLRSAGQSGDTAGIDADIIGYATSEAISLARTVWTRWPKTYVETLPITTTPSTKDHSENELP